ncbi:MAG: alpha/beta fold hydrolase [Candidatus Kariarchaeaceae archaeon]|jgi:pimeloyl-ACP methyl ester carboxylesterase
MFIDINGVRLNTVSFGRGDRTFLAHGGFIVGWEMWIPIFELLSKKWGCVSYDHRGVGESRVPIESISDEEIIKDVFRVMDKLRIKNCILIGESMGGRVAINAALRHPERFDGLILIGSPCSLKPPMSDEEYLKMQTMLRNQYDDFIEEFVRTAIPEPNSEHLIRWGKDICHRTEIEAAIRYLRVFEGPDEIQTDLPLDRVTLPTLVIHGTLDYLVSLEEGKTLASTIPNAIIKVFEDTGHVPSITKPNQVVEAIEDWLETL